MPFAPKSWPRTLRESELHKEGLKSLTPLQRELATGQAASGWVPIVEVSQFQLNLLSHAVRADSLRAQLAETAAHMSSTLSAQKGIHTTSPECCMHQKLHRCTKLDDAAGRKLSVTHIKADRKD